jgi:hypothetical protein
MIDTQQQYIKINIRGEISITVVQALTLMNIATWLVCTRYKWDFIPFSIDSRCLLQIGDE